MNITDLPKAIDFYNKGNSLSKTCKEFHTTPNTLKKLFKEQNIHIRDRKEQLIIENIKRTKAINHGYFNPLTQESAYYLGFIAADGTIRKDRNEIKIGLSSIDKDFLEEFKNKIQVDKKLTIYQTSNGFECCELSFSSLQIKLDLMSYGIVPNKTIIGLSLDKISEEFKLSFIKGFFDGDGSFSYNKNTKQAKITFTSKTKGILEDIKNYFQEGRIYQDKRNNIYSLEFSTIKSIDIMEQFYKLDTPCLKRKKIKYLEFLNLRNKSPRDRISLD